MKCTIEQIAQWTEGKIINNTEQLVTNVVIDTRQVSQGSLFIPFQGHQVDGHQFVNQAFEQGATLALWEENVPNMPLDKPLIVVKNTLHSLQQIARQYRASLSTKIIAVTGSNGKTTTKDIISNVLASQYKVQKTQGNYNNEIGVPLTVLSLSSTTDYAIIEMGMDDFGQIEILSHIVKPDIAVITNIGESHMQQLGSRQGIAQAKSEIITALNHSGLFIYNGDEPLLVALHQRQNYPFNMIRYGLSVNNDVYAQDLVEDGLKISFNVDKSQYELPIIGRHNIYNALPAIIIGRHLGISPKKINESFKKLELTPMRMQVRQGIRGSLLINDAYNASPTSMKAAIDTLTTLPQPYKILIVADMLELGHQEVELHQEIGNYLVNKSIDLVLTYGSLAKHITQVLLDNGKKSYHFETKQQLIEYVEQYLNQSTVILAKGSRSMQLEVIFQNI